MAMAATISSSSSSSSHAPFSSSMFQECTKGPSVMDCSASGGGATVVDHEEMQHADEMHGGRGLGSCIVKVDHAKPPSSFGASPDSSSAATDSSCTDEHCKQQSSDEKNVDCDHGFEGGKVKVEPMEIIENDGGNKSCAGDVAAAWQANGSSTHDEWLLSKAVEKLQPLSGINSFYNSCCLLPEEEGGGEVFGNIQVQLEEDHDFYLNDEDPTKMMGSWNPNEWDTEAFCEQKNMPQLGIPAGGGGEEARMETDHACSQQQQILQVDNSAAAWDPFSKQPTRDAIIQSNSNMSRGISLGSSYNDPTGFYSMNNKLGTSSFMGVSPDVELQQTICHGSDCLLQMPLAMVVSANNVADMRPGTPAATTRAARKSRMARKRRSIVKPVNAGTPMTSTTSPWSSPAQLLHNHHRGLPTKRCDNPSAAAAAPPADSPHHHKLEDASHVLQKNLKFLLQKQLKPSDVGNLGRIVLPKKEAESRLPYLTVREGIILVMDDMTTPRQWNLRYRFWPNNKSRMYLLENTGEFIKSHRLCEGDFLLLYKDCTNGNYVIYGKKADGTSQNAEKRDLPGTKQQGGGELKVKRAKSLDSERKSSSKVALESTVNHQKDDISTNNSAAAAAAAAAGVEEEPFVLEGGTGLDMLDHFPLLESSDLAIDEILELVDMPAAVAVGGDAVA